MNCEWNIHWNIECSVFSSVFVPARRKNKFLLMLKFQQISAFYIKFSVDLELLNISINLEQHFSKVNGFFYFELWIDGSTHWVHNSNAFHEAVICVGNNNPLECDHRQRYRYYAVVAMEQRIPASIIQCTL